jgi:hypothetical protein
MFFPNDMTKLQACKLAVAHWKRMIKNPRKCDDHDETPDAENCGLCEYNSQQFDGYLQKYPKADPVHCQFCPLDKWERLNKSESICGGIFVSAADAFFNYDYESFRKYGKTVLAALEKLLAYVEREEGKAKLTGKKPRKASRNR